MNSYDIKELVKKLAQGTITNAELTYFNKWMDSNQEDGLQEVMDEDWSTFNQTEELQQAPKWMSKTKPTTRFIISWKRHWAVAASFLLILISGMVYFGLKAYQTPTLVYETNTKHRKRLITLPDQSKVWLKRNSTLSYWWPFKDEKRVFNLEGEAFFDVTSDPTRPFIVQSNYLVTKVHGTAFNIISWKNTIMPEVALVEGALEVAYIRDSFTTKPLLLKPGERVRMNLKNNEIISSIFVEDEPYAWKDDIIHFQKADVQEVARTLEAWYNIKFKVQKDGLEPSSLVHRYDTKALKIEEVLNGISSVMPYRFKKQKDGSYLIESK